MKTCKAIVAGTGASVEEEAGIHPAGTSAAFPEKAIPLASLPFQGVPWLQELPQILSSHLSTSCPAPWLHLLGALSSEKPLQPLYQMPLLDMGCL